MRKVNILGAIFRLHNFLNDNPDPADVADAPPTNSIDCIGTQPVTIEEVRTNYILRSEECVNANINVSTRTGSTARMWRDNIKEALWEAIVFRPNPVSRAVRQ